MANIQSYIEELIEALTKLPGVGRKGAERIAYFIVRSNKSIAQNLTASLENISDKLSNCDNCGMIIATLISEELTYREEQETSEKIVNTIFLMYELVYRK